MKKKSFATKLSNPASTGGSGHLFEAEVQASFVALMLTKGFAPCLPPLPITKILLQGRKRDYNLDDLVVFAESPNGAKKQKMLAQIKESIKFNDNKPFQDVITAAWLDFNNPAAFTRNNDALVLITGPLAAIDIAHTRDILEWARTSHTAKDFIQDIKRPVHAGRNKTKKHEILRALLKNANNGKELSDEEFFSFLRHFHILSYDLDIKAGVVLALLHSLISKCSTENVGNLWGRIVREVQTFNKTSGEITIGNLPEDLLNSFKPVESIPTVLTVPPSQTTHTDWNQHQNAADLEVANLLGSWDENSAADITIIEKLSGKDFKLWLPKMHEVIQLPDSPLVLKNAVWKVHDRASLWRTLGSRTFATNLKTFKECALVVLGEIDPQFDLPKEQRYAASIHNKVLRHSEHIRKGIAETLALLGSQSDALKNCPTATAEGLATEIVDTLLKQDDWRVWGSLDQLLPTLSEAAPSTLLAGIETALKRSPTPFKELFAQEGTGITGRIYTSGLLWGLENIAWDEQYLVRTAVVLAGLAERDPGGNYANRPQSSLSTIFLPWFPQTKASVEKRKVAVQTVNKESPRPAWKLLLSLLPDSHQVTSGSHKPVWRNPIQRDFRPVVTHDEYWDQITFYSDLAIEEAQKDAFKLEEVIPHLNHLPPQSLEKLFKHLQSPELLSISEDKRVRLWERLSSFLVRQQNYPEKGGTLSPDDFQKLNVILKQFAPIAPTDIYPRLFKRNAIHSYFTKGDWKEAQRQLEKDQQKAVKTILAQGGVDAVVKFAGTVEDPTNVGVSLGVIADADLDQKVLPILLNSGQEPTERFLSGYIWIRYRDLGEKWITDIGARSWAIHQTSQFLLSLPFNSATWKLAKELLGKSEGEYWQKVQVNPYQTEDDLSFAIDKLLAFNRPKAAIGCFDRLAQEKKSFDANLAMKALLGVGASAEPAHAMNAHDTVELIKALQERQDVNKDQLLLVEWAYVQLLERDYYGAPPKTLELKLASDPKFFLEILQLLYKSKKVAKTDETVPEQKKQLASNAHQLLSEWRTPPGTQPDGTFSGEKFTQWLEAAKRECSVSGHLEVALIHIGEVLIYSPKDPSGLWINKTVAEELNKPEADDMRNGFRQELYNSRGVHWVDPTAKPELELADKYKKQAEDVENAGFHRLSEILKDLGKYYEGEAARIIAENKSA